MPVFGREVQNEACGDHVRAGLQPYADDIGSRRLSIQPRFDSVDDFCTELLEKDAYVLDFRDKVSSEQWQAFCDELPRLAAACNVSDDGSLVLELTYLQTVARKRDNATSGG